MSVTFIYYCNLSWVLNKLLIVFYLETFYNLIHFSKSVVLYIQIHALHVIQA